MPEENEDPKSLPSGEEGQEINGTLYALAMDAIKDCISIYLGLAEQTKNFNALSVDQLKTEKERVVVLGGIASFFIYLARRASAHASENPSTMTKQTS